MSSERPIHPGRRSFVLGTMAVAGLAGCGGGGISLAGISSGGTGSFTTGTITGLGSIIVNGIRYSTDSALVTRDGTEIASGDSLQVGMVVSVEGSAVSASPIAGEPGTATAYRISYGSEWIGPLETILADGFTVFGNTVRVDATTIFSGVAGGLSSLRPGQFVQVYGYFETATGQIHASRIEVSDSAPSAFRLSGFLSSLNTAARTAQVGSTPFTWPASLALPDGLMNGAMISAEFLPNAGTSPLEATEISLRESPLDMLANDQEYEAEIKGSITAYRSPVDFSVNLIPVDASAARVAGTPALGAQVEVKGRIVGGQLIATEVEVKSYGEAEQTEYEFHGAVSNLDLQARTFVLRDQTFYWDETTEFEDVDFRLANLPPIEVKAMPVNGRWLAIQVEVDD